MKDVSSELRNACESNDLSKIKEVLRENPNYNINTVYKNKQNLLHIACEKGNTDIIEFLYKSYCHHHIPDDMGETPMDIINKKQNSSLSSFVIRLELLIQFFLGCLKGETERAEILLEKYPHFLNEKDADGKTALLFASSEKKIEMVEFLIAQKGCDLNAADKYGRTPLLCAVKENCVELVKILLNHHADPNLVISPKKITPLYTAAENGFKEVVENLLSATTIDIHKGDIETLSTPLHIAVFQDQIDTAKLLIDNKADVNKKNRGGLTPLHCAIHRGNQAIVKLLLKSISKLSLHDKDGKTVLDQAISTGNISIIELVQEKLNQEEKDNASFVKAAKDKDKEKVKALLARDIDVNVVIEGKTAIYHACSNNDLEMMKILLAKEANVNQQWGNNTSLLMLACQKGNVEIVNLLLANGAQTDLQTHSGNTALHVACQFKDNERDNECVESLLKAKAAVNLHNKEGLTALSVAVKYDNEKAVDLFIEYKIDLDVLNKKEVSKDGSNALEVAKNLDKTIILKKLQIAMGQTVELNVSDHPEKKLINEPEEIEDRFEIITEHNFDKWLKSQKLNFKEDRVAQIWRLLPDVFNGKIEKSTFIAYVKKGKFNWPATVTDRLIKWSGLDYLSLINKSSDETDSQIANEILLQQEILNIILDKIKTKFKFINQENFPVFLEATQLKIPPEVEKAAWEYCSSHFGDEIYQDEDNSNQTDLQEKINFIKGSKQFNFSATKVLNAFLSWKHPREGHQNDNNNPSHSLNSIKKDEEQKSDTNNTPVNVTANPDIGNQAIPKKKKKKRTKKKKYEVKDIDTTKDKVEDITPPDNSKLSIGQLEPAPRLNPSILADKEPKDVLSTGQLFFEAITKNNLRFLRMQAKVSADFNTKTNNGINLLGHALSIPEPSIAIITLLLQQLNDIDDVHKMSILLLLMNKPDANLLKSVLPFCNLEDLKSILDLAMMPTQQTDFYRSKLFSQFDTKYPNRSIVVAIDEKIADLMEDLAILSAFLNNSKSPALELKYKIYLLQLAGSNQDYIKTILVTLNDNQKKELLLFSFNKNFSIFKNIIQADSSLLKMKLNNSWNTILHLAAMDDGHPALAYLCKLKNTDISGCINRHGNTALHLAALHGCENNVKFLFEQENIDIKIKNMDGNTPAHLAIFQSNIEVFKLFLSHNDVSILQEKNLVGRNTLHLAAFNGNNSIFEEIMNNNSDSKINWRATDTQGNSVLHLATIKGHQVIVQLLLSKFMLDQINIENHFGETPLLIAVSEGHWEIAKLLLIKGADPSIEDINHISAISLAETKGYVIRHQFISKQIDKYPQGETVTIFNKNNNRGRQLEPKTENEYSHYRSKSN